MSETVRDTATTAVWYGISNPRRAILLLSVLLTLLLFAVDPAAASYGGNKAKKDMTA